MGKYAGTLILIIRHAEKPDQKGDPNLSPAGVLRAKMLSAKIPALYPNLSFLFAAAQSPDSNRPVLTIQPLAAALKIDINDTFADHNHKQLAKLLLADGSKYLGKALLICWHHEKIPALAKDLGAIDPPDPWPDDVFDQIWQITYADDDSAVLKITKQPPVQA